MLFTSSAVTSSNRLSCYTFSGPPADPHGLVGMKVNIIQEDDSNVEGMVVNFDATTNQHYVLVGLGTPDEAGDHVPLAEYPDAYNVSGLGITTAMSLCRAR